MIGLTLAETKFGNEAFKSADVLEQRVVNRLGFCCGRLVLIQHSPEHRVAWCGAPRIGDESFALLAHLGLGAGPQDLLRAFELLDARTTLGYKPARIFPCQRIKVVNDGVVWLGVA